MISRAIVLLLAFLVPPLVTSYASLSRMSQFSSTGKLSQTSAYSMSCPLSLYTNKIPQFTSPSSSALFFCSSLRTSGSELLASQMSSPFLPSGQIPTTSSSLHSSKGPGLLERTGSALLDTDLSSRLVSGSPADGPEPDIVPSTLLVIGTVVGAGGEMEMLARSTKDASKSSRRFKNSRP